MLWYKAWLDTRWRFFVGLGLLVVEVLANELTYPDVQGLLDIALKPDSNSLLVQQFNQVAQISSSFRGYIWAQLIRENMFFMWALFAVLLGADGPFSRRTGTAFTLSLPVSRRRLRVIRSATDLTELFLMALLPTLLIPLFAPAVGHSYSLADSFVYGVSIFLGGAVFYCLALLLAALFEDRWRAIVCGIAVVVLVELCKDLLPALAAFTPAGAMTGESYFHSGTLAWASIVIWAGAAAALFYAAVRFIEARDF